MNSIEVLKKIYKPLRYTIKGKATILNTTSGDYVLKEQNKNIKDLYSYLQSRDFFNYPKLIDENRKEVNVFEYISEIPTPNEQKSNDLIKTVCNLHNKTCYFKEVTLDKFQHIYDDIKSNILYLKDYYNNQYDVFFKNIYHRPSEYLFLQNFYKIDSSLDFCDSELDNWFELVKDENTERVALIHNNLSLDHFIVSDKPYLISWDNFAIDTPILDLVKLYKNNYLDVDFSKLLETYMDRFPLSNQEKKLFFIIIALPDKIEFSKNSEFELVKNMRKKIDYIFKTDNLIRPYYTNQEEE